MNENIKELIDQFGLNKKNYSKDEVEEMLERMALSVAKGCMDSIVANVEYALPGERAWWTIRDTYDIEVKTQAEILPCERTMPKEIEDKFNRACIKGDIETIKSCLEQGAIISSEQKDYFVAACQWGSVETVKFFLEEEYSRWQKIKLTNYIFEYNDDGRDVFDEAILHENLPVLEYLIAHHDIEKHPIIKDRLETRVSQNVYATKFVEKIISSKELNQKLTQELPLAVSGGKKKKI